MKEEDKDCEEEHDGWKDVIKKRSVSDLSNETNKRAMKVVELRRRRAQIFKRMGVLEDRDLRCHVACVDAQGSTVLVFW